jgi:hypothetical protein
MRHWSRVGLVVLALYSVATVAPAQDDATKARAREMAQQGMEAAKAGDHQRAQDLFHRAYALVPAPTIAVREARALVALGRWVHAVEAYVRATRTPLPADAPAPFRDAVRQAESELSALRPRLPKLRIQIEGVDPSNPALEVRVDGVRWPAAVLGVSTPIDPGKHVVIARTKSGNTAKDHVALAETESKSIKLTLPPEPETTDPPGQLPMVKDGKSGGEAKPDRTLAFVGFGVGVVGLGVGIGAGLAASSKHSSAEDGCIGEKCVEGSSGADDVDSFRQLRTISTVGYIVGAVGIGAGVTLWLTAPKSKTAARTGAFVGPASVGVRGAF